MKVQITHQGRYGVFKSGLLNNINSLDELDSAIELYGLLHNQNKETQEYRESAGAFYEVYAQFWLSRYLGNPQIGVKEISDTSTNKHQRGLDFLFTSTKNQNGLIQVKWRKDFNNPHTQFTEDDLSSFFTKCAIKRILLPDNAIFFTNLWHIPASGQNIIKNVDDDDITNSMRIFDRSYQEKYILKDADFWNDFRQALVNSCKTTKKDPFKMFKHQQDMFDATNKVMVSGGRGRVICATGGGKTLVQYYNTDFMLNKLDRTISITVAPTRDLVNQHFYVYQNFGFFDGDINPICFKSGSEPYVDENEKNDEHLLVQTLNENETVKALSKNKKSAFFTTYKSFFKLYDILKNNGYNIDLIIFDEFQHLVSQGVDSMGKSDMKQSLESMEASTILFYSASEKRGKMIDSNNESIFGPKLMQISYRRLRKLGVLVPKLELIIVRLKDIKKIKGLDASLRNQTRVHTDLDLRKLYLETTGMLTAFSYVNKTYKKKVNMITASKSVNNLRVIQDDETVQKVLKKTNIYSVYADKATSERTKIYEAIANSTNNLLLQHSCVNEGIDVPNLNVGYAARNLNTISLQQFIGRIVRAAPEDRENFEKLSISNPRGWKKYKATMFILIDDETDDAEDYYEYVKDIVSKLQYAGLENEDYDFLELSLKRGDGTETNDPDQGVDIDVDIEAVSIAHLVDRALLEIVEYEKDYEFQKEKELIAKMSKQELIELLTF